MNVYEIWQASAAVKGAEHAAYRMKASEEYLRTLWHASHIVDAAYEFASHWQTYAEQGKAGAMDAETVQKMHQFLIDRLIAKLTPKEEQQ
jgi:hypothetical protein